MARPMPWRRVRRGQSQEGMMADLVGASHDCDSIVRHGCRQGRRQG